MIKVSDITKKTVLVSNDKRTKGKEITALGVVLVQGSWRVKYNTGKRAQRIRIADIFPPGTKVARGWNIKA